MESTIRERLVQSLSHKRAKLMKEKEQLDIADTNALLLHPSQFSITNPSSPGGGQTSRKTRFRGNRADAEELGNQISTVIDDAALLKKVSKKVKINRCDCTV